MSQIMQVWIFNGEQSHLPSAVFLNLELAEKMDKGKSSLWDANGLSD
jgi:hypothetical protein